jgi:hypothetical protein
MIVGMTSRGVNGKYGIIFYNNVIGDFIHDTN